MKRFFILSALAVIGLSASMQEASAWINSRFGMGMNWGWQSGGNCLLGGLFRDGQPGSPDFVPGFGGAGYGGAGCGAPGYPVAPGGYPAPGFAPASAPTVPVSVPSQAFRQSYRPASMNYYGR